jgi:hypothetical protein
MHYMQLLVELAKQSMGWSRKPIYRLLDRHYERRKIKPRQILTPLLSEQVTLSNSKILQVAEKMLGSFSPSSSADEELATTKENETVRRGTFVDVLDGLDSRSLLPLASLESWLEDVKSQTAVLLC